MKKSLLLVFACFYIFTSCLTEEPFFTVRGEVYTALAKQNNNQLDTMIAKVGSIEKLQEFNEAVKIIDTSDEMEIISAIIDASIEGEINKDSLQMTKKNTLFILNRNNVSHSTFVNAKMRIVRKGYELKFPSRTYDAINAREIWEQAMRGKPKSTALDSITKSEKGRIESNYTKGMETLNGISYIVLVNDVLLVKPTLNIQKKEFESGYILTHAYAYDFKTLESVGQEMIISSNGDQISFYTSNSNTLLNENALEGKIRNDLINKKNIAIDSTFGFD